MNSFCPHLIEPGETDGMGGFVRVDEESVPGSDTEVHRLFFSSPMEKDHISRMDVVDRSGQQMFVYSFEDGLGVGNATVGYVILWAEPHFMGDVHHQPQAIQPYLGFSSLVFENSANLF